MHSRFAPFAMQLVNAHFDPARNLSCGIYIWRNIVAMVFFSVRAAPARAAPTAVSVLVLCLLNRKETPIEDYRHVKRRG